MLTHTIPQGGASHDSLRVGKVSSISDLRSSYFEAGLAQLVAGRSFGRVTWTLAVQAPCMRQTRRQITTLLGQGPVGQWLRL